MPCKLLIIDDDDDVRESLLAILRGEGFVAEGAKSGLAALDLLTWRGFAPHAIVLDLLMPAMSGEQFRGVVQKHPVWSKIPIIVCTADRAADVAAVGAFGVLYKPFDLEKLLELVRSACAASGVTD